VRVIDRCTNIFKLANGEWVSPENVEAAFVGACQSVQQIFIHGGSEHEVVVAIVVPRTADRLAEAAIVAELQQVLSAAASPNMTVRHFEVPTCVHIASAGFTAANGMMTASGKLCRCCYKQSLPFIECTITRIMYC
jgi:long-subunit acyl-CoA synthetase (AMP-forming)